MAEVTADSSMRLDKWLWVARFYKTRSLAADDVLKGRIAVNGQTAKPSRAVRVNDRIELRDVGVVRTVMVLGLAGQRGPAPQAQALYAESAQSLALREQARLNRSMGVEPATAMEQGRPTKRDRRELAQWQRWSVSADD
jgi:ribosome-associated heat shock protein Hsp15